MKPSQSTYHVGKPNLGSRPRLLRRIRTILNNKWLSNNGPFVQELEERLARYLGVRNCVIVCNATIGLELAARATGLNGEVIIPAFTFIATAHALEYQGIKPIFCDIDQKTHNLDCSKVEDLITDKTSGILAVHLWGRPCDIVGLTEIARRRGLRLLFDSAHAFGCSHKGKMIGCFGDAEVFSFHATKFFNTCEGGAVTTNDDQLADKVRLTRNFGFAGYDNVESVGTNAKMTEVCAAFGLTNFESLDKFISINRRNYHLYRDGLKQMNGLTIVEYDETQKCNYQYVVVEVETKKAGKTRDHLLGALQKAGILARRYFFPGCHNMRPYRDEDRIKGLCLPITDEISTRVIVLPTGVAVNAAAIKKALSILALETNQLPR